MRKNYWKRLKKKKYSIEIPQQLRKYLTSKQRVILTLFSEGKSINELAGETKLSREEILFQLVYIGRSLAYYEIAECEVLPNLTKAKSSEYLLGWNTFKQTLSEVVRNGKIKSNNKETVKRAVNKTRKS